MRVPGRPEHVEVTLNRAHLLRATAHLTFLVDLTPQLQSHLPREDLTSSFSLDHFLPRRGDSIPSFIVIASRCSTQTQCDILGFPFPSADPGSDLALRSVLALAGDHPCRLATQRSVAGPIIVIR
jgi:hypothetical protein